MLSTLFERPVANGRGPAGGDEAEAGVIDHAADLEAPAPRGAVEARRRLRGDRGGDRGWLAEHDVVFAEHDPVRAHAPLRLAGAGGAGAPRAVECLCGVLDRFCDAYPADERLRAELDLPAFEDSLVRVDPGYDRPLRICRLDAF